MLMLGHNISFELQKVECQLQSDIRQGYHLASEVPASQYEFRKRFRKSACHDYKMRRFGKRKQSPYLYLQQ